MVEAMPPVSPELSELLKKARQTMVEPAGECPYCHGALERRSVYKPFEVHTPMGSPAQSLFVFWACTNDSCCLMFHKLPAKSDRFTRPITDDAIEH
jgi:hypothetical protein